MRSEIYNVYALLPTEATIAGQTRSRASYSPDTCHIPFFQTLPPILDRTVDKDRQEATDSDRMKIAMWQKPLVPKPFLIHLGVIARTHSIPTFQDQFFDEFTNFFIDK